MLFRQHLRVWIGSDFQFFLIKKMIDGKIISAVDRTDLYFVSIRPSFSRSVYRSIQFIIFWSITKWKSDSIQTWPAGQGLRTAEVVCWKKKHSVLATNINGNVEFENEYVCKWISAVWQNNRFVVQHYATLRPSSSQRCYFPPYRANRSVEAAAFHSLLSVLHLWGRMHEAPIATLSVQ